MRAELLFGPEKLPVKLPEHALLLETTPAPVIPEPLRAVEAALAQPIGSPPLQELARGKKSACVVISDITRPVPNQLILPPLLQALERAGVPQEGIVILIATGMHRPNLGEELEGLVGREVAANYRIENHYCRRQGDLRLVDHIDGAPIEINRHYLDAELKILTGLIEPHMYAGYSGGRKAILPGISSLRTMEFMHSFQMIDHPRVTNCVLEGNPFHEAGEKVARLVGADFILNVVIDQKRRLTGVFAGHWQKAHLAGCRMVEKHAVHRLKERADLVVTSGGGAPLDATFYQVSKGLIMARNILRPGGTIVIACQCREGLGSPDYCGLIRRGLSAREFFRQFRDPANFVTDQWCLQTTYQAVDHAGRILVYSPELAASDLEGLGMEKIDDLQAAVDALLPDHPRVVVVPEGPYVVGLVEGKG